MSFFFKLLKNLHENGGEKRELGEVMWIAAESENREKSFMGASFPSLDIVFYF